MGAPKLTKVPPDDAHTAVGPFLDMMKPKRGSFLFGTSELVGGFVGSLVPPLSGRPRPPSQAALTMRAPARYGSPQPCSVPTKANGLRLIDEASAAKPSRNGTTITSVSTTTDTMRGFMISP